MKLNSRYVIPALASIALTATVALAQMPPGPGGPRGPNRTPPTAEQMAARQAQFCTDLSARQAARFTFIEERLKLTSAQKLLFDRWKTAVQSNSATRQADCAKPRPAPGATRPTLPERNARMEEMLKTRLAALEKTRGPEEALYNALTAEQKPLFESAGRRGGDGMGMRGRGPGGGFGGHGHRGRGFGGPSFGGGPGMGPGPGGPGRGGVN